MDVATYQRGGKARPLASNVARGFESATAQLINALRAKAGGRPSDTYRVCGFEPPDADLSPRGDAGIICITHVDAQGVTVVCGAHKTFRDPSFAVDSDLSDETMHARAEAAHAIVFALASPGEWTGDDWGFGHEATVTVPWFGRAPQNSAVPEQVANTLIDECSRALEDVRQQWADAHARLAALAKAFD